MKKSTIRLIGYIEALLLIGTLIFFILAHPKALTYVVDKFTVAFNLSYKSISGNLLKEIELKDLAYDGKILATKAKVKWNILALLKAEIVIEDIVLKDVDLKILNEMITDLAIKNQNKRSTPIVLPYISIKSLFFSTKPYYSNWLRVDKFEINIKELKGDLDNLSIKNFQVDTVNDHTNIIADGYIKNKELRFNHLWIQEIDVDKILNFKTSNFNHQEQNSADKNITKNSIFLNLLEGIFIDDFKADIKPFQYKGYKIDIATVTAKGIKGDFKEFDVNKLKLDSDTNLGNISLEGKILTNRLISKATLNLYQPFYDKYIKDIDFESFNPAKVDLEVDKSGINAKIYLDSNRLFYRDLDFLDIKIKESISNLRYDFNLSKLTIDTKAKVDTLYSDNIELENRFVYDKSFISKGVLKFKSFKNIPKELQFLLHDAKADVIVDNKSVKVNLDSLKLNANFNSVGFKKAKFNLISKEILARELFKNLPPILNELKFKVRADSLIDFQDINSTKTFIDFTSNAFLAKANLSFTNNLSSNIKISLSKESILKNMDKNIKWNSILPLDANLILKDQILSATLKNDDLNYMFKYNLDNKTVDSVIDISGQLVNINGALDRDTQVTMDIESLLEFQNRLAKFYNFQKQPIDAKIKIKSTINSSFEIFRVDINSPWFLYEYEKNHFSVIQNLRTKFLVESNKVDILNYYMEIFDKHFFSNRKSYIEFDDKKIKIKEFWINDQAVLSGVYDLNSSSAKFDFIANNFYYKAQEGEVIFDASLKALVLKDEIKIEGDVLIKDGVITYEPKKEHYVKDDDIIIIQEELTKAKAKEQDKLVLDIKILTKNRIKYKVNNIDVDLESDIQLWKEKQKELELLGIVKLLDGSYVESNKEFLIQNSEILFGGKILNPYLNIKAIYKNEPYLITINILGTLEAPVINFSSNPYLSQSDILSLILFNTATNELLTTKQSSSAQALSMFGNTFAKELVSNFGIKLDKLVLITTESGKLGVEVGKRLSKKLTIIYINDDVSAVKIKYEHSPSFETDLLIKPDSSGVNFSYKREY